MVPECIGIGFFEAGELLVEVQGWLELGYGIDPARRSRVCTTLVLNACGALGQHDG